MFVAAYSQEPEQKRPKCPSTDDWGSTIRSVHVTGYYPDTERSNVLTPALENVMLSGRSQTPKATDSAGFRLLISRDTNPEGSENTLVAARAGGRGGTTDTNGYKTSFLAQGMFWYQTVGHGYACL